MSKKKSLTFKIYTCLFFIICIIGYIPYWTSNKSMIWQVDAIGQYYPAFIYIGHWLQKIVDNLLHGVFSIPLFDLSIGMGEDIIGCLNYYGLGDPLNILAIFITDHNAPYLFSSLFFLRVYLAGLTFLYYCKYMNLNKWISLFSVYIYIYSLVLR